MKADPRHLVELLRTRFFSRTDIVAVGQKGSYPKPASPKNGLDPLLFTHVMGSAVPPVKVTYQTRKSNGGWSGWFRVGSYVPNEEGLTPWICLDFDGKGSSTGKKEATHSTPLADPRGTALKTFDRLKELGFTPYLEISGSGVGWHVWVFFQPMVPALKARLLAFHVVPEDAPLTDGGLADASSAKGIEVFPKANTIRKGGCGNLVWLPWHFATRPNGGNAFHQVNGTGSTEVWVPDEIHAHTEEELDAVIEEHQLADQLLNQAKRANAPPKKPKQSPPSEPSTLPPEAQADWKEWRAKAVDALALENVYGEWLTGVQQGPGWIECRDPASPTGDRNPSAGVATGEHGTVRGQFFSFRDYRTLSVFDFLVDHGPCADFKAAVKWIAEKSGIPPPKQELPTVPEGFLNDASTDALTEAFGSGTSPTPPGEQTSKAEKKQEEPDADTVAKWFVDANYRWGSNLKLTLLHWNERFWVWGKSPDHGGYRYRELKEDDLRAAVRKYARQHYSSVTVTKRNNIIDAVKADVNLVSTQAHPSWLRASPPPGGPFISMENHIMNFNLSKSDAQEIKLLPHTPDWFSTICLPYPYNPDALCPQWLAFLDRVMEGDEERIRVLQEFCGYCFYPQPNIHRFLLIHGEGRNGKSVFLTVLEHLVGLENRSTVPLERFEDRFALFSTLGKLVNIAAEIGELDKVSEGILKMFASGDTMPFEQKFKDVFSTRPTAKLVFACNTLPRFTDRSEGIWRRIIPVPFRVVIPPEEVDRHLPKKLLTELSGIFNWALEGLRRLHQQNEFSDSQVCAEARETYRRECNPTRVFLEEEIERSTGGFEFSNDIYQAYNFWMTKSGMRPMNKTHFMREFNKVYWDATPGQLRRNGKRLRGYHDIRIVKEDQEDSMPNGIGTYKPYKDDDDLFV